MQTENFLRTESSLFCGKWYIVNNGVVYTDKMCNKMQNMS